MTQGTYIDPDSALRFTSWSSTPDADGRGAFTFGMTLLDDAATKNATDYVGVLVRMVPLQRHVTKLHSIDRNN